MTWDLPATGKHLYLTFDDGPTPGTTPRILEILHKHDAKATFFCVGENVVKHPDIYQMITDAGHEVGNHGYNHLKGWETDTATYVANVRKCREVVNSDLFRPPYGKIRPMQRKVLREHYRIIMWTVLSRDYDARVDSQTCLEKTWKHTRPGAIIVFHDHAKSLEKLREVLPEYLRRAKQEGYHFDLIKNAT